MSHTPRSRRPLDRPADPAAPVRARRTAPRRRSALLAAALVLPVLGTATATSGADEFQPVSLAITAPAKARLDRPITVGVRVTADPGALDHPDGALRVRVKLAPECGGDFAGTQGPALLDAPLPLQPVAGQALDTSVAGTGKAAAYGVQAVCVFLESTNDQRQYVTDVDTVIDVSQSCTVAARRVERDRTASKHATKALKTARTKRSRAKSAKARASAVRTERRARATAVRRRKAVSTDTAKAQATCGPGVAL